MANYSNLKTAIENAVDWNNGDNEITGQNLLDILETIIDSLGAKYKFADVATPSSSISTPDEPLFYLAGAGTYANFSGLTVSVQRGTLAIFYYDTAWHWTSVRTDSDAFFNVNQYLEAPSTTYTKATGRNAVPEALRSKGMIITYLTTNGWIIEQNLSTSGTWNADANWQTIGPVSVSQNSQTGHTDITIGDTTTPVASVEEVSYIESGTIGYTRDGSSLVDGYWDWTNLNVGDTAPASMEGGMNVFVGGVFPIKGGVLLTIKGKCGGSSASFLYVLTDADRKITKKSAYTSAVTEFTETPSVDGYIYITNQIAAISDFKLIEADRLVSVETLSTQNSVDIESLKRIQITQWSKNLFNPNDKELADGKFLGDDGKLYTNSNTLVTGYIPLTKEMGKLQSSVNGSKNTSGGYIWLYDKDFNRVNGYAANTAVQGCATWETAVAFVRFSITKGDNIQVERGNVVTEYVPYGKYVANECIDNKVQLDSTLIKNGIQKSVASLNSGAYLFIQDNTPKNIHRDNLAVMEASIADFNDGFRFAKGGGADNGANYFDVDDTNITWSQFKDGATTVKGTYAHGLYFSEFVKMCLIEGNGTLRVVLQTLSGTFVQNIDNFGYIFNGQVYVKSNGTFTDVKVAWSNDYLRKSVWMFGDSYFGMDIEQRELYWLNEWDCLDVLVDNMAGINSQKSYEELQRCLTFGTPKKLVWCLGMNDGSDADEDTPTTSWSYYIELIEEICKKYNIELILATIPNVPAVNNEGKNKWVRESGYRYIDVASAVGANVFESGVATWYGENGGAQYLEGSSNPNNRIHPTTVGAKAIATQFLVDFPDLRG